MTALADLPVEVEVVQEDALIEGCIVSRGVLVEETERLIEKYCPCERDAQALRETAQTVDELSYGWDGCLVGRTLARRGQTWDRSTGTLLAIGVEFGYFHKKLLHKKLLPYEFVASLRVVD